MEQMVVAVVLQQFPYMNARLAPDAVEIRSHVNAGFPKTVISNSSRLLLWRMSFFFLSTPTQIFFSSKFSDIVK
jgi:hypothetical protein